MVAVVASAFDHGLSSIFILSGEDDVRVAYGVLVGWLSHFWTLLLPTW